MDRMDRVNQQMKEEVAKILLRDLSDPRLEFVSITKVKTSRDLRNATVYFSILGGVGRKDEVERALEGAGGMIRRLIGSRVNLRNTPLFSFIYDDFIESSIRMEETFKEMGYEDQEDPSVDSEE